ncbi:MAG: ATP-binding protein [Synechococcaceae cyanobacterium RL_1_2]|nr:ATP-binding protein [Synechococcaceae cyanobacterium RL_1_2]
MAYLKGFRDVLKQEQWLNRLWIKRGSIKHKTSEVYEPLHDALLKLKQYDLNEEEAEDSLSLVERSSLIKHFDDIAIAWLMVYGAELKQAQLIVRRLNHSLWGYLLEVVIQNPLSFVQLQSFVALNQSLTQQESDGILDRDREQYRANLVKSLNEPFRGEYFALKDLYVKPSAMPIVEETENPYDLHDWAKAQLELPHSISFIEGPSGSGKSAFCKIFATYVSRCLYPDWMPVVVNLQRLTLGKNLIHSLESLTEQFPPLQEWLTQGKMRCVILLDGLDNLRPLPHNHQHPALILLQQITQFLENSYLEHKVQKYKVIVTGNNFTSLFRPYERQNLNRQPSRHSSLPMLMETHGIRLLAFDKPQIRKWFQKWLLIQSKPISQAYFSF